MFIGRDRRVHTRYVMPSSYTSIAVRPADSERFLFEGHAYDVSEGGMRFEIDEPIPPGSRIAARIDLPGSTALRVVERRPVYVMANVVWIEEDDLDLPGPVRMACVFRQFVQPGDRDRLLSRLTSGRYSIAA